MDTLDDALARGRERDGPVLDAPGRNAPYSYREFCTNAWKAGNLLRHYGVRPGARVALVVGPKSPAPGDDPGRLGNGADPLLALLGGAALGATVDVTPDPPVETRALVLPDAWLGRYDGAPGCSRLAYGGPPEEPGVAGFERELWSENPVEPPASVAPSDPVLRVDGEEYTHADLVGAGRSLARDRDLGVGDRVGVDAPLTSAGAVTAGVVAPLVAGATVRPVDGETAGRDLAYVVRAGAGVDAVDPFSVIG